MNKKEAILTSALQLFHTKGYAGTSLRMIAERARVNVAHISYYFQNKQGLLEYCFALYYEEYIDILERAVKIAEERSAKEALLKLIEEVLGFHRAHNPLARFVLREMTIDSQIVREVLSTYVMRERYYLKTLLEIGMEQGEYETVSTRYCIIQLKSLLTMPYLQAQYMSEVWQVHPQDPYFEKQYKRELFHLVNETLFTKQRLATAHL